MSPKPFGTSGKDTMKKPINTSDATTRRRAPYVAPVVTLLSLGDTSLKPVRSFAETNTPAGS